ncbi:MAG: lipid-A-disaccharide synthase [Rikenellaceae bacterium]|nr:lipid-A-disaccharide synthase [Rikenellaceae bacterium]
MKYYLIAGEASGDLHGANLMRGILKADPDAEFRFWGGDKMEEVGGCENLIKHYAETSFMGFWEVLRNLRTILGQMRECRRDVEAWRPDVLILIDYAGFNLRMARFAKRIGLPTYYYIAPKVWAWKESRVRKLRRYVDRLFVIFPFEIDYFRRHGIEPVYEGNPLMDSVEGRRADLGTTAAFAAANGLDHRPIVALLAGSRAGEIRYNLPFMAELAERFPSCQFVVAGVPWLGREHYDRIIGDRPVRYVCDRTYDLLAHAEAAVVTSGTATLETALIGTPEVVCYRTSWPSILIGRLVIKVPFVSLVNLIMGREVVRELLQHHMTMSNAEAELRAILPGGGRRERMLADFEALRARVGGAGASDRFGARMVALLRADKEKNTVK